MVVLEEFAFREILNKPPAAGSLGSGIVDDGSVDGLDFGIHSALCFDVVEHRATLG